MYFTLGALGTIAYIGTIAMLSYLINKNRELEKANKELKIVISMYKELVNILQTNKEKEDNDQ